MKLPGARQVKQRAEVQQVSKAAQQRRAEIIAEYPKGCLPPSGYIAWFDWAEAQYKHGLRQSKCPRTGLYKFPQELDGASVTVTAQQEER